MSTQTTNILARVRTARLPTFPHTYLAVLKLEGGDEVVVAEGGAEVLGLGVTLHLEDRVASEVHRGERGVIVADRRDGGA